MTQSSQTLSCNHCGAETEDLYLGFENDHGWLCERCKSVWTDRGELPNTNETLEGYS